MENNKKVPVEQVELEYIRLNFDNCFATEFNLTSFKKGVAKGSYLSGILSCLLNSGIEKDSAVQVLCKIVENETFEIKKTID